MTETKAKNTGTEGRPILIREGIRAAMTGVDRRNWARLEEAGNAPKRVRLSPDGKSHGWVLSEVHAWITARIAERDAAA